MLKLSFVIYFQMDSMYNLHDSISIYSVVIIVDCSNVVRFGGFVDVKISEQIETLNFIKNFILFYYLWYEFRSTSFD